MSADENRWVFSAFPPSGDIVVVPQCLTRSRRASGVPGVALAGRPRWIWQYGENDHGSRERCWSKIRTMLAATEGMEIHFYI
jgi:hypothetical protein